MFRYSLLPLFSIILLNFLVAINLSQERQNKTRSSVDAPRCRNCCRSALLHRRVSISLLSLGVSSLLCLCFFTSTDGLVGAGHGEGWTQKMGVRMDREGSSKGLRDESLL